jgi:hypothetical protein
MPTDEAELAELRQANAHYAADYERRLAKDIVMLLPEARDDALRVLALVAAILNLPAKRREAGHPKTGLKITRLSPCWR